MLESKEMLPLARRSHHRRHFGKMCSIVGGIRQSTTVRSQPSYGSKIPPPALISIGSHLFLPATTTLDIAMRDATRFALTFSSLPADRIYLGRGPGDSPGPITLPPHFLIRHTPGATSLNPMPTPERSPPQGLSITLDHPAELTTRNRRHQRLRLQPHPPPPPLTFPATAGCGRRGARMIRYR